MNLLFDNFKINFLTKGKANKTTGLVFLHGFTGSSLDWEFIFNFIPDDIYVVAIDLPGHGKSDSPKELKYYSIEWICNAIDFVVDNLGMTSFSLCGYSMGGRVAINYAFTHPSKISKLILESSTAGIESDADRKARIASDNNLALLINKNGVDSFIDYWMDLELFSDLKNLDMLLYSKLVKRKKENSVLGLTNTLIGFGTGTMTPLWDKLSNLKIPTLLITGSLDKKFTNINQRMNKLIQNSQHKIFSDCGHNVHTRKPKEFFELLINFVQ